MRFRKTHAGDAYSRGQVDWPFFVGVSVVLTALAFGFGYQYLKRPVGDDYAGRVVDKSLTLRETLTGTRPVFRLLVRGSDGREFQVGVNDDLYQRARVGMWVRRSKGVIELSWDEPAAGPPRDGGDKKGER